MFVCMCECGYCILKTNSESEHDDKQHRTHTHKQTKHIKNDYKLFIDKIKIKLKR